jgi:hypothetical protein
LNFPDPAEPRYQLFPTVCYSLQRPSCAVKMNLSPNRGSSPPGSRRCLAESRTSWAAGLRDNPGMPRCHSCGAPMALNTTVNCSRGSRRCAGSRTTRLRQPLEQPLQAIELGIGRPGLVLPGRALPRYHSDCCLSGGPVTGRRCLLTVATYPAVLPPDGVARARLGAPHGL